MTGQDVINDYHKLEDCHKQIYDQECITCALFSIGKQKYCAKEFEEKWERWNENNKKAFYEKLQQISRNKNSD